MLLDILKLFWLNFKSQESTFELFWKKSLPSNLKVVITSLITLSINSSVYEQPLTIIYTCMGNMKRYILHMGIYIKEIAPYSLNTVTFIQENGSQESLLMR